MTEGLAKEFLDGVHVDYPSCNAYQCYIPEFKRVFQSKDVTYLEKLYRYEDSVTFEIGSDYENSDEKSLSDDDKPALMKTKKESLVHWRPLLTKLKKVSNYTRKLSKPGKCFKL